MSKMKKCCVRGCTDEKSQRHRFPKRDPDFFENWLQIIQPPNWEHLPRDYIYDRYYVCHAHFEEKYHFPGSLRGLLCNAIPTIGIPGAPAQQKKEENSDRKANQHLGYVSRALKNEQTLDARCMSPSRLKETVRKDKKGIPDTPPISEVCIEEQNFQQKTKIPLQDTIDEEIIKVEYLEEYQPTNDLSTEEIMSDLSDLGCSTVSAKNRRKRSISDKDRSSVEQYSSKKQKLNAAQEQSKKSSSELFLLSLVPHLESMTDHQQLSFQRQVIQLLEIIKFPDNKDH